MSTQTERQIMPWHFYKRLFIWVYVKHGGRAHVHLFVLESRVHRLVSGIFPSPLPPYYLRQGLPLNLELNSSQKLASQSTPGLQPPVCLPRTKVKWNRNHHAQLSHRYCNEHFTYWAISQCPYYKIALSSHTPKRFSTACRRRLHTILWILL